MFNSFGGGQGAGGPFGGTGAGGGFPAPGIPNVNANAPTTADTANPAAGSGWGATPGAAAGNPFAMDPAAMQQILSMMGGMGGGTQAPTDTRPPEERFQIQLQVVMFSHYFSLFCGFGRWSRLSNPKPTSLFDFNYLPCFVLVPFLPRHAYVVAQQLQDMGFTDASGNVRALLATGGNVHSAIEYILNGGGVA
jgi:ubiquilin